RVAQARGVQSLLVQGGCHDAVRLTGANTIDGRAEKVISGPTAHRGHDPRLNLREIRRRALQTGDAFRAGLRLRGMIDEANGGSRADESDSPAQPGDIADDDGTAQRQQLRPGAGDDLRPDAGDVA